MANSLIVTEYLFQYPYCHAIAEDIHGRRIAFSVDVTCIDAQEAHDILDRKIREYEEVPPTKDEIRNMSMDQYAHYRRLYFADDPYTSGSGILTQNSMLRSYNSRNLYDKLPSSTSRETTKSQHVESPKNYYHYYWSFVKAETQDAADYAMDNMLRMVNMDLQPRPDGKSWAEDPALPKPKHHWKPDTMTAAMVPMFTILALSVILHFIGVY